MPPHSNPGPGPNREEKTIWELMMPPPGVYNQRAARERSLARPVTAGAELAGPLLSIAQLRMIIENDPQSTVVVSDVHGQLGILRNALTGLGLLADDRRLLTSVTLVSVGDLIDGRSPLDLQTLGLGAKVFDRIVVGNHETAHMRGGGKFVGQLSTIPPELRELLHKLAEHRILVPVVQAQDVLISHGGIAARFAAGREPATVVGNLQSAWDAFLVERTRNPELFESGIERGGSATNGGGVLWEAWSHLVRDHPPGFRQICGHSPLGSIERSKDGLLVNLDVEGDRIGIAVVTSATATKPGQIHVGSDFLQ